MIYLIGGAPRVGKSIIAKNIAARQKAELILTDDVCNAIVETLSPEEKRMRFPFPGFSGTASENTFTPEEYAEFQLTSARSLEQSLNTIVTRALTEHRNLVVEGVYLLPEHVHRLMTQHGSTKFSTLFIGSSDVERTVKGIMNDMSPNNWMRESDIGVIRQVAAFIAAFSKYIHEEALAYDLPYQERTEDFEGDMKRLSERLLR